MNEKKTEFLNACVEIAKEYDDLRIVYAFDGNKDEEKNALRSSCEVWFLMRAMNVISEYSYLDTFEQFKIILDKHFKLNSLISEGAQKVQKLFYEKFYN